VLKRVRGATDLKRSIKFFSVSVVSIRLSQLWSTSGANTCKYRKGYDAERLLLRFALFDREEGTKKEAISQHKHLCKLSYSWKIAHNNNANFVFLKELPDFYN